MQYFCLYGIKETQICVYEKMWKKFTGNFGKLHIITHACKSMHFLTCMYIGVAKLFILLGQLVILFIFLFYSLFFICIFLLYKDS
jgi:hypothetical protein